VNKGGRLLDTKRYVEAIPELLDLALRLEDEIDASPDGLYVYEDVDRDGTTDAVRVSSTEDSFLYFIRWGFSEDAYCEASAEADEFTLCRSRPLGGALCPRFMYTLDRETDYRKIISMLYRNDAPNGVMHRARRMGFTVEKFEAMQKAKTPEDALREMRPYLDEGYLAAGTDLPEALCSRQEEWNALGDEFFRRIRDRIGEEWNHRTYNVLLSPFIKGVSGTGNLVFRSASDNRDVAIRTDAREVTLARLYRLMNDRYDLPFQTQWAIGEISSMLLLDEMPDLFPRFEQCDESYFRCWSYPQLAEPEIALRVLFETAPDFDTYLDSAVEFMKGYELPPRY